jgi:lipopolysaccharide heptosyltransferase II
MKILIIRLGAIGDIIRTVPAVLYLKEKLNVETVHWVAEDWASNLLLNHPDIEKVYVIPRKRYSEAIKILNEIKQEKYDYLLDFHGLLKSGLLSFFSGIKKRVGFHKNNCKELNHLFNNIKAPFISEKVTRIEKNFNLLKPLIQYVEIPETLKTNFNIEMEKKEKIETFLQPTKKFQCIVGINPCTSKSGSYKEWPIEYYKKLIHLASEYFRGNVAFVITWGPGERDKVLPILKAGEKFQNVFMAPETDMKELMVLISKFNFFVTGDTGPMHLASTLNIPILALFGPSDSEVNKPWGKRNIVSKVDVGCNPCRNKKCSHLKCQRELTPEIVFNDFKKLVSKNKYTSSRFKV